MKRNFKRIVEDGWVGKLHPFLLNEKFTIIEKFLMDKTTNITPKITEIFRAFKECPYAGMKVIIVGSSPYQGTLSNGERIADGLAFSSRNSVNKPPQSLEIIYKAIENNLNITMDRRNNDLTYLANQGVLLLNCALTTEKHKKDAHLELWQPFIEYVLKMIHYTCTGMIYVFVGENAQKFQHLITGTNDFVISVEEPEIFHKDREWDHDKLFFQINAILDMMYNTKLYYNTND